VRALTLSIYIHRPSTDIARHRTKTIDHSNSLLWYSDLVFPDSGWFRNPADPNIEKSAGFGCCWIENKMPDPDSGPASGTPPGPICTHIWLSHMNVLNLRHQNIHCCTADTKVLAYTSLVCSRTDFSSAARDPYTATDLSLPSCYWNWPPAMAPQR